MENGAFVPKVVFQRRYNEVKGHLYNVDVTKSEIRLLKGLNITKIVSEYDQEIPQSQTADNPVAPRGRAAQPSRDTRKTN